MLFTHQANGKWYPHDINLTLTLNQQVVETLVSATNGPIQEYTHSDDHIHLRSAEMLIHLPRTCRGKLPCGSLLTATICVVWNLAIKDLWYTGLAVQRSVGYAILISSKRSVTAIHDCHFPSDLAMCRREDLTRPWINAHVLLALISFSPSPGLISSLRLN